jgi:hypothetical protein
MRCGWPARRMSLLATRLVGRGVWPWSRDPAIASAAGRIPRPVHRRALAGCSAPPIAVAVGESFDSPRGIRLLTVIWRPHSPHDCAGASHGSPRRMNSLPAVPLSHLRNWPVGRAAARTGRRTAPAAAATAVMIACLPPLRYDHRGRERRPSPFGRQLPDEPRDAREQRFRTVQGGVPGPPPA